jgi:hypothetical protein
MSLDNNTQKPQNPVGQKAGVMRTAIEVRSRMIASMREGLWKKSTAMPRLRPFVAKN